MNKRNKLKIINDPVYGFITIPSELIFDLIEHSYFQRLRRISQMGMSYLVYPGAHHTRFHHALGCVHLMRKAVGILRFKGTKISAAEEEALLIAILLHDIGHGPFSHAMEHSIIEGVSHETISLKFMQALNTKFEGKLDLAIQIFTKKHPRKFLQQLLASQLDIDRLDYLKRDSFFTGVAEGNINSERIITMMNVSNNELVIEEKGIYSVEKFLVARRLMYWQVYLHKTGLVAEQLLIRIFKRAKYLAQSSNAIESSPHLDFFLKQNISEDELDLNVLEIFSKLDDFDVVSAIKQWTSHQDFVLQKLCSMLINRNLLKIKLKNKVIKTTKLEEKLQLVMDEFNISREEANYFVFTGSTSNTAYHANDEQIKIMYKNGKTKDVAKASDQFNLKALSQPVIKYYISYPKFYN